MLDGKTAASMPPQDARYLRVPAEDILRDYSEGMKQAEIARRYGISKHAVCDVVNGNRSADIAERITFTKKLLEHEDRWSLILDYERTLSEAQAASSVDNFAGLLQQA
jgi:DNA-binding transcriptional regulator LsrR (DeoR family)